MSLVEYKDIKNLIKLYFNQPHVLYEHLFSSYNQLIEEIIPYTLIKENNYFYENVDKTDIFLHGFRCKNIRIKPAVFDSNPNEILFPDQARKNHLNYFANIYADIEQIVERTNILTGENTIKVIATNPEEDPIAVASIPIMVKSKYCSTTIKKDSHNECKYDPGGYFLVNGKEKVVMSIEKMVDNKPLVFTKKDSTFDRGFMYTVQINSKLNDWSDNLQILNIKEKKDGTFNISTSQLYDIKIIILMRALGLESDQDIISNFCYSLDDINMINLIKPSIDNCVDDEGNLIRTKDQAIDYLVTKLRKNKRFSQTDEELAYKQKKIFLEKIFRKDLLPHLEQDIKLKIRYICYMFNKMFKVILDREEADDRDALQNKRIETPGVLIGQLFRQNWKKLLNEIGKNFKKKNQSDENPVSVLNQIKPNSIEQGIKTALSTGIWGMNKTKKGVAQALQRLSWFGANSYLRRIMAPSLDAATASITKIRLVNNLQASFYCLTKDSYVLLNDRYITKDIQHFKETDKVISLNNNLIEEPSKIYNYFERMADDIMEITTISGRTIKATGDHPFMIFKNRKTEWIPLKDIKESDLIVIRNCDEYIDTTSTDFISDISDNTSFTKYDIKELSQLEYIKNYNQIIITNDRQIILARLLGYIKVNGDFTSDNNEFYITINKNCESCDIINDIKTIGFNVTKFDDNRIYINTRSFVSLINYLYSINWILNTSNNIKREFLSSVQGSIGSELYIQNNTDFIIDNITLELYNYDIIHTINKLFSNFNIKTTLDKTNNKCSIKFDNILNNLVKLSSIIGYRYSEQKRINSALPLEYAKTINYKKKDYCIDDIKILSNGSVIVPIHSIKNCEPEMVYDFTTESDNHNFIANSFVTHNCPTETPEGANIGIIKSLSMSATITTQNTSQLEIVQEIIKSFGKALHPTDISPNEMSEHAKVFMNGTWIAVTKDPFELYTTIKKQREHGILDKFTTVFLDFIKKEICIFSDGGRLIRPILQVHNNKINMTPDVLAEINKQIDMTKDSPDINKNNSWNILMDKFPSLLEYEDIESSNYLMIAQVPHDLEINEENKNRKIQPGSSLNRYGDYRYLNYTHCDIHPWLMLGYVVCSIPFSNHNFGLKNIIFFSHAKQSIGVYLTSYKDRMDISQVLYHPQVPIVTTEGMKANNSVDLPFGENVIIAIMTYMGYNQEDSIIFNKSSIDRGLFLCDTLKKEHTEIVKNPSTSQDDVFTKPDQNKVTGMRQGNYDKLNEKGFIPEETIINDQDIIIGKVSPIQPTGNNNKVYKDNSIQFKSNVDGVIDRVHTGVYNNDGYEMYNVRLRMERVPIIGDKFCQKGEVQVLTYNGWKEMKDITIEDRVATMDKNNKLIYVNPSNTFEFDHDGEMYSYTNKHINIDCTLNHKLYVKTKNSKKYNLVEARNMMGKMYRVKSFVDNNFDEIEYIKIGSKNYQMNSILKLIGMYISDGSINKNITYITCLKDRKKEYNLNYIRDLQLDYIYSDDSYRIKDKDISNFLKQFGTSSKDKQITKQFLMLSKSQSNILLDSLIEGHGTVYKGFRRYGSISNKLINDISILAFNCGFSSNIQIPQEVGVTRNGIKTMGSRTGQEVNITLRNTYYKISILENQLEPWANKKKNDSNIEKIYNYKGKVYCIEVPESHIYFMRNDMYSTSCWIGNSNRHG